MPRYHRFHLTVTARGNRGQAVASSAPTPHTNVPTRQYKQPRLAEMIANDLRNRILNGEIADGEMLPRQEELLEAFRVSMPSLRGALQILETERLITVLRGSVGGAVVHT